MTKIAVVTTFSKAGYDLYAKRMVESWLDHWPASVDLFAYPDEFVHLPYAPNFYAHYDDMPQKRDFIARFGNKPRFRGMVDGRYNYRFDAVKFCHKPFALHNFMVNYGADYSGLIWLDADTVTHRNVPMSAVHRMAPCEFDVQFLGRCYKYSECGYIYFNLAGKGCNLLHEWVSYYVSGSFRREAEWHDSFLFDRAREKITLKESDLTGHLPRKKGAGAPFGNSFLGGYLNHLKGDTRKRTGAPRKGELFVKHDTDYWNKAHPHAQADSRRPET